MRSVIATILALLLTACGGGSGSPTAPTQSMPNVGGNYSGALTIVFPELATSVSCPGTTSVTQSGSSLNIAPIILSGQCAGLSIPLGAATIDATGNLAGGAATGTYTDPSCGTYTYTGSGGFFGREMRISMNATSRTCYNMNITILLSR